MAKHKGAAQVAKNTQALERLIPAYVPIGKVRPNSYNPNRQGEHEFELLCRSMKEDGFTQSIVVVTDPDDPVQFHETMGPDGKVAGRTYVSGQVIIVDGEHRWRAAGTLGYTEVPVAVVPMTLEQARIATLRHNKAKGSHDLELEAQVLRELRDLGALDWAQDSLMMDDVEMQRLLDDVPAPVALAAEDYSPAWEPASAHEGKAAQEVSTAPDGSHTTSMTAAAVEAVRQQERALAVAKTEEEKAAIKKDSAVFRLVAVFTGEEAKLVKAALGEKNPAQAVLDLCRRSVPVVA